MSVDDSGLSHCVVFSCQRPATNGTVYCAAHMSLIPAPSPSVVSTDDTPLPDGPAPPDMAAMEPEWDGARWVLREKKAQHTGPDLDRMRQLVRELAALLEPKESMDE